MQLYVNVDVQSFNIVSVQVKNGSVHEKMKKRKAEIDPLKDNSSHVDILKEQVAFLLQMQNTRENQVTAFEESINGRRSKSSKHRGS
ncbi:hypothetical protein P8452_09985 [Trifolium repens]|nr:hypothetical protein P8452_09985 [Trifolium repens]